MNIVEIGETPRNPMTHLEKLGENNEIRGESQVRRKVGNVDKKTRNIGKFREKHRIKLRNHVKTDKIKENTRTSDENQ